MRPYDIAKKRRSLLYRTDAAASSSGALSACAGDNGAPHALVKSVPMESISTSLRSMINTLHDIHNCSCTRSQSSASSVGHPRTHRVNVRPMLSITDAPRYHLIATPLSDHGPPRSAVTIFSDFCSAKGAIKNDRAIDVIFCRCLTYVMHS